MAEDTPTQQEYSAADIAAAEAAAQTARAASISLGEIRTRPYLEEEGLVVTGQETRGFNISNFRAEINKNDIQPTHSYLVTFAPFRLGSQANAPLTEFVRDSFNKLVFRCETVVLPTVQVLEEETFRRYGYGPVEKVPYGMQFNDLTLTWLVDKRSELIDFFYQWMNTITHYETRGGSSLDSFSDRFGLDNYLGYEVGYKDEFTCPLVRVRVYDRELNMVTEYIFYDVFPMNIQGQNLSWSQENEAQKLTVTFAFTNMATLTPRAGLGKLETALEAQAAADAAANAAEKENKKKKKKDYSRRRGQNPQNSVNASSPDATNNEPQKATGRNKSSSTTTTKNLNAIVIV